MASSVSLPDVSATVKVSVRLVCYLEAAGKDAHFWAHLGHWQFQFPAVAGSGTSLLCWLSAGGHMQFLEATPAPSSDSNTLLSCILCMQLYCKFKAMVWGLNHVIKGKWARDGSTVYLGKSPLCQTG